MLNNFLKNFISNFGKEFSEIDFQNVQPSKCKNKSCKTRLQRAPLISSENDFIMSDVKEHAIWSPAARRLKQKLANFDFTVDGFDAFQSPIFEKLYPK